MEINDHAQEYYHVLVTGANSGLGLASCRRLIDEFLFTTPQSQTLVLIITTRSQQKGDDTVSKLRLHLHRLLKQKDASTPGISKLLEPRIRFQQEILDLTSLLSVRALARRLGQSTPKLDVIILNAGIGGWDRVDFVGVIRQVFSEWVISAFTWPNFKISLPGSVAKPQVPAKNPAYRTASEPALGEVFCANVFGHYLLVHGLMEPLSKSVVAGRIIWVSTLEAHAISLDPDNLQAISAQMAYEASKRLSDVLSLTSELPATVPWTDSYFSIPESAARKTTTTTTATYTNEEVTPKRPKMYVSHPGVCATSIFPLPWILNLVMIGVFYFVRWCGSIWHTCDAYTGATAQVWLALASEANLDYLEQREGAGKWGSAVDRMGDERVERTEVEGWGYGGIEGDARRGGAVKLGRKKDAKDLTSEARERFEDLGRHCWKEMERLRLDWTRRLEEVEELEPPATIEALDP